MNVEQNVMDWMILVEEGQTLDELVATKSPVLLFFFQNRRPHDTIAEQLRNALLQLHAPGFAHLGLPNRRDRNLSEEEVANWIMYLQQTVTSDEAERNKIAAAAKLNAPIILYAVDGSTPYGRRLAADISHTSGILFDPNDSAILMYSHGIWIVSRAPDRDLARKLRNLLHRCSGTGLGWRCHRAIAALTSCSSQERT